MQLQRFIIKIIQKISSCLLINQFRIDFISQTYTIEQNSNKATTIMKTFLGLFTEQYVQLFFRLSRKMNQ